MKNIFALILFISLIYNALAQKSEETDSIKNYNLGEITIKSPKYNSNIYEIPAAASMIPSRIIENYQIKSLPDVSGIIPNFFMPDYGSKLTSPVYIRGIGTRINTPSVGLYVDHIPYFEKSAFNFDFFDLERIEVLRGPQGTLYGRNTMGGLINIFTTEPLNSTETSMKVSYGNFNQLNTNFLHNQPIGEKTAVLLNLGQLHNDGFYTNAHNGEQIDKINSYSGRLKLLYQPVRQIKMQFNFQYENSNQGGYPYAVYHKDTQVADSIRYDHVSSYDRDLLSGGFNFEYAGKRYKMRAVTSYQHLNDYQDIDQDFTPKDMYSVGQRQKQHMFAQEINFQSYENEKYEWLCGIFGFRQTLGKTVDVAYGKVIQAQLKLPGEMVVSKEYDNTNAGVAFFHQSTLKRGNFSVTGGIRFDFEKATLDYLHYQILLGKSTQKEDVQSSLGFFEILPMVALKYNFGDKITLYGTVAKGYNSGGFNSTFEREEDRSFKPEQSINYETGVKSWLFNGKLFTNLAFFFIDWRNQQIYQPVPSGQGSMLKNAGKSESLGAELDIKYLPSANIEVWGTFGYNKAQFIEYIRSATIDYSGNNLPYVPEFTLSFGSRYTIPVKSKILKNINLYAVYQGFGKHYWHEDNSAWQDFYGLLNSRISLSNKIMELAIWGKNLLNADYNAFYFTALNNSYVQLGKPSTLGLSLKFTI